MRLSNKTRIPLIAALISATALSGCLTTGPYKKTHFSDGAKDVCQTYRQSLISAKDTVNQNTAMAAVLGAVAGFVIAKKAGASTGEAAGIGLAAAVGTGFFANQASQGQVSEERQKLLQELRSQAGAASQTPGTIAQMTQCRRNQVAEVKRSVDAGHLTQAAASSKLKEIKEATRLDNELVGEFIGEARDELDNYVQLAARDNISEEQLLGKYNDPDLPWLRQSNTAPAGTVARSVSANGARIRANSNTSSAVLGSVSTGDSVYVTPGEGRDGWEKIVYRDRPAYIHGSLLAGGGSGAVSPTPAPVTQARTGTAIEIEGDNEQQIAVRDLSRSTHEAESEQKKLQAVDTEIDGLLAALNA